MEIMGAALYETTVTEIIQRTRDVFSFRAALKEGMQYRAGQFMGVTVSADGKELSRYLSFSSAPTEKGYLEFTKKITASDFSKTLMGLRPGDTIRLKMPLGSFLLDETAPKHFFLSGGIGITPLRSMCRDALDRVLPVDMALLYGNRSPEDIAFRDDFENAAKSSGNFKVIFSLDTAGVCPSSWKGRCGFIDAAMIREEAPDYLERVFYVCGPPGMVGHLTNILETELKVPAPQIKRENFAGY